MYRGACFHAKISLCNSICLYVYVQAKCMYCHRIRMHENIARTFDEQAAHLARGDVAAASEVGAVRGLFGGSKGFGA